MNWILIGGIWGFLGVALGAFGAHGLEPHFVEKGEEWWKTAVLYHLVHAPLIVFVGLLAERAPGLDRVGWSFLIGSVIFSGTLYAMALGAPRWFGAITPLGGIGLLAGWLLLALAGRKLG